MNKLSIVVKGLCNLKGLKMRELAEKMGISSTSLSQLLSRDNPQRPTLRKFAAAFDMSEEAFTKLYLDKDSFTPDFSVSGAVGRAVNEKSLHNVYIEDSGEPFEGKIFNANNALALQDDNSIPLPITANSVKRTEDKPKTSEQKITATIDFEGQTLFAKSLNDLRRITNIIVVLKWLENNQNYKTCLDVRSELIKKYGK